MYQAAVPGVVQTLQALSGILDKAAAHCEARKVYPDMHPFTRQIQITTDQAKGLMARLAGREIPAWPDTESSIPELKARVAKALDYVKSFKPEDLEGSETREITMQAGGNEYKFPGAYFAFSVAFPNFYFHAATAYDILRHCGVEIGKRDFMGVR
jgi:hypothetical protein